MITFLLNAFGIMANRWQCMISVFHQLPSKIQTITEAVIILHMCLRAPQIQNKKVDTEDQCHKIIRVLGTRHFKRKTLMYFCLSATTMEQGRDSAQT